jgi:hypothetical protein
MWRVYNHEKEMAAESKRPGKDVRELSATGADFNIANQNLIKEVAIFGDIPVKDVAGLFIKDRVKDPNESTMTKLANWFTKPNYYYIFREIGRASCRERV